MFKKLNLNEVHIACTSLPPLPSDWLIFINFGREIIHFTPYENTIVAIPCEYSRWEQKCCHSKYRYLKLHIKLRHIKKFDCQSGIFPGLIIHKYTFTSCDGKTHCQVNYILVEKIRLSIIIYFRSVWGTDSYPMGKAIGAWSWPLISI